MTTITDIAKALADDSPPERLAEMTDSVLERRYIGASSIGHPCERSVALRLRGYPTDTIPPSKQRIFDAGHLFEELAVRELRRALEGSGCELVGTGDILTEQVTYRYYGKVCRAHSDGVIIHPDKKKTLVEIKSANDDSFQITKRLGVRVAHQEYYDQMILMMGLGEMHEGLFYMINKDNSKTYVEVIQFDEVIFNYLKARIEYIAAGQDEKIASSPSDWRCGLCNYKQVCWYGHQVPKDHITCRHCRWSQVTDKPNEFAFCTHPDVKLRSIPWVNEKDLHQCASRCFSFTDRSID